MSRNNDRLGANPKVASDPDPQLTHTAENNDFSFIIPTELVDLPTKGIHYGETHPLHGCDSIEIKQMTAKEEDMLTSRTLLKKGVALDRVISSLIVNKAIDPDSLFVGDRNALIIAARISAYGNQYETKVSCPGCGASQENSFDLNKINMYEGADTEAYASSASGPGIFITRLPKTGLDITFKLLTGADERRFLAGMEHDRKNKNVHERGVTRQLVNMIVAVNGNTTQEALQYLVENIPSADTRHLRNAYKATNPDVDLTQYFECSECDYESDLEVPLTSDFFWPDA